MSLEVIISMFVGCLAFGWCVGKAIKTIRQFFDFL